MYKFKAQIYMLLFVDGLKLVSLFPNNPSILLSILNLLFYFFKNANFKLSLSLSLSLSYILGFENPYLKVLVFGSLWVKLGVIELN